MTQPQLDYLTDPQTLKLWSGLTLDQRRVMLHRQFPELKISRYHLRLAYRQAGIKKKAIRIKKSKPPQNQEKINQETKNAFKELMEARLERHRIIYCDEMCTTRSTIQKAEWSERRFYPKTETKAFHKKTIATIAAISQEKGVELVCNFPDSVNQDKFIKFLKKLRAQKPYVKMALFLDQLQVHKTTRVKECAAQLKIPLIYNASYSPNYNPIEGVIGLAKAYIKQKRWHNLQNEFEMNDE